MLKKRDFPLIEAIKRPLKTFKIQIAETEPYANTRSAAEERSAGACASLRPHEPLKAGDLWTRAIEKLSENERMVISEFHPDDRLDILTHLIGIVEAKRDECGRRSWVVNLRGRRVVLREVANRVITWIKTFKEVGDAAVQFSAHAALPVRYSTK